MVVVQDKYHVVSQQKGFNGRSEARASLDTYQRSSGRCDGEEEDQSMKRTMSADRQRRLDPLDRPTSVFGGGGSSDNSSAAPTPKRKSKNRLQKFLGRSTSSGSSASSSNPTGDQRFDFQEKRNPSVSVQVACDTIETREDISPAEESSSSVTAARQDRGLRRPESGVSETSSKFSSGSNSRSIGHQRTRSQSDRSDKSTAPSRTSRKRGSGDSDQGSASGGSRLERTTSAASDKSSKFSGKFPSSVSASPSEVSSNASGRVRTRRSRSAARVTASSSQVVDGQVSSILSGYSAQVEQDGVEVSDTFGHSETDKSRDLQETASAAEVASSQSSGAASVQDHQTQRTDVTDGEMIGKASSEGAVASANKEWDAPSFMAGLSHLIQQYPYADDDSFNEEEGASTIEALMMVPDIELSSSELQAVQKLFAPSPEATPKSDASKSDEKKEKTLQASSSVVSDESNSKRQKQPPSPSKRATATKNSNDTTISETLERSPGEASAAVLHGLQGILARTFSGSSKTDQNEASPVAQVVERSELAVPREGSTDSEKNIVAGNLLIEASHKNREPALFETKNNNLAREKGGRDTSCSMSNAVPTTNQNNNSPAVERHLADMDRDTSASKLHLSPVVTARMPSSPWSRSHNAFSRLPTVAESREMDEKPSDNDSNQASQANVSSSSELLVSLETRDTNGYASNKDDQQIDQEGQPGARLAGEKQDTTTGALFSPSNCKRSKYKSRILRMLLSPFNEPSVFQSEDEEDFPKVEVSLVERGREKERDEFTNPNSERHTSRADNDVSIDACNSILEEKESEKSGGYVTGSSSAIKEDSRNARSSSSAVIIFQASVDKDDTPQAEEITPAAAETNKRTGPPSGSPTKERKNSAFGQPTKKEDSSKLGFISYFGSMFRPHTAKEEETAARDLVEGSRTPEIKKDHVVHLRRTPEPRAAGSAGTIRSKIPPQNIQASISSEKSQPRSTAPTAQRPPLKIDRSVSSEKIQEKEQLKDTKSNSSQKPDPSAAIRRKFPNTPHPESHRREDSEDSGSPTANVVDPLEMKASSSSAAENSCHSEERVAVPTPTYAERPSAPPRWGTPRWMFQKKGQHSTKDEIAPIYSVPKKKLNQLSSEKSFRSMDKELLFDDSKDNFTQRPNLGVALDDSCSRSSCSQPRQSTSYDTDEHSLTSTNYWASHSASGASKGESSSGSACSSSMGGISAKLTDEMLLESTRRRRNFKERTRTAKYRRVLKKYPTASFDSRKSSHFSVLNSLSLVSGYRMPDSYSDHSGSYPSMRSSIDEETTVTSNQSSLLENATSGSVDIPQKTPRQNMINNNRKAMVHHPAVFSDDSQDCISPRSHKSVSFSLSPGLSNLGLEDDSMSGSHLSRVTQSLQSSVDDDTAFSSPSVVENTTSISRELREVGERTMVDDLLSPLNSMVDEMFTPLKTMTSESGIGLYQRRLSHRRRNEDKDEENLDDENDQEDNECGGSIRNRKVSQSTSSAIHIYSGDTTTTDGDGTDTGEDNFGNSETYDEDDHDHDGRGEVTRAVSEINQNPTSNSLLSGSVAGTSHKSDGTNVDENFQFSFVWGPINIKYVSKKRR